MKKIFSFLFVLFSVFILTACEKDVEKINTDEILEKIVLMFDEGDKPDSITKDFTLTNKVDEYIITWKSNHSAIEIKDDKGIITRTDKDSSGYITASVTIENKDYTKPFNLVVKAEELEPIVPVEEIQIAKDINEIFGEDIYSKIPSIITNDYLITEDHSEDLLNIYINVYDWTLEEFNNFNSLLESTLEYDESLYSFKIGKYLIYTYEVTWEEPTSYLIGISKENANDTTDPIQREEKVYLETFETLQEEKENGGNFSEYSDHDFVGDLEGLNWEIINTRIDLFHKGTNALTFWGGASQEDPLGRYGGMYTTLNEGLSKLEFDVILPFPDKDANKAHVYVFINDEKIFELKLTDDKSKHVTIDDLNIKGTFDISIQVSSGHRITVDNVSWVTNIYGVNLEDAKDITVDFEDLEFKFDATDSEYIFNDTRFILKEVQAEIMHADKEVPYMTEANGNMIARFRGAGGNGYENTPTAYMYNIDPFISVSKITFDARLFGSEPITYNEGAVINVYYKTDGGWKLLRTIEKELNVNFNTFTIDVNQTNVQIKIEVLHFSVNIDNILFVK